MAVVYDVVEVVKRYPGQTSPANKNVTFRVAEGEIFGILGDNGAGKSTLVRQMVNLTRSTSGAIELFGRPVAEDSLSVPLSVGYMPQDGQSLNRLTAAEALYFSAHLRGLSAADARRERDALLERWQIEHVRDVDSSKLSGGERRLLRLAVAMAGSPPVLMLDEPTSNLDPLRCRLVWDVLRSVNRERGTTVVFITHDALEAERVIERVGIMHKGELVAVGSPAELKQQVRRRLRMEVRFSPIASPELPPGVECERSGPGYWVLLLEWAQVKEVMNRLSAEIVEDFRVSAPTLEDLFIHYVSDSE